MSKQRTEQALHDVPKLGGMNTADFIKWCLAARYPFGSKEGWEKFKAKYPQVFARLEETENE